MKRSRSLHPICDRLQVLFAVPVITYLLIPLPLIAQVPTVIVAPGSGNTRVYVLPSGGPTVVDVATPNAAGLSHNQYTNYNVSSAGLVLNNAVPKQFTVPSQLAGTITANFNLRPDTAARVILNEVVSPHMSNLAGYTEIAGAKADLVVANPYGITVNGAGFLNTSRVTLATAQPLIGTDGRLSLLRATGGELLVTGLGLDASRVDFLNLLGRAVRLDGQVNAPDLTVSAGAHDFDYATQTATALTPSGTAPSYAIDSSVLGGMYTDRIRLIANEAGVGVRLLGDVAAAKGDFTIDAAGLVQLSGRAYAAQDLRVNAVGVTISGDAAAYTAKRDLTLAGGSGAMALSDAALAAGRDLTMSGASLADSSASVPVAANRFAVGNVTVHVAGASAVSRSGYGAGGQVAVDSGSVALSNLASIYSGADAAASARGISVRTTTGDLNTGSAQLTSSAGLALTADRGALLIGNSETGTGVQAQGDMALSAATTLNNAGTVLTNGALTLRSNSTVADLAITNSGRLQAAGALSVAARDAAAPASPTITVNLTSTGTVVGRTVDVRAASLNNAGAVQGAQGVTMAISGAVTTGAGSVLLTAGEPGGNVTLTADSLDNAGSIQSTGNVTVALGGAAVNSGAIRTLGADQGGTAGLIVFNAQSLDNSGNVQSAGTLALTASNTGNALTNSGTLQSTGGLTLAGGNAFTNTASGRVLGGTNVTISSNGSSLAIDNAGRVQAAQTLTLGGPTTPVQLTQAATGITLAGGALLVPLSSLDNAGIVQTGNALALTASGTIINRVSGAILTSGSADKNVTLSGASLTNAGQVQSTGALTVNTTGFIDNSGTLLTLASDAGGAARGITLAGETFTNSGLLQSAAGLTLAMPGAIAFTTNRGTISVADSFALTIAGNFTSTAAGSIVSGGDLKVFGSGAGAFNFTNAGRLQSDRNFVFGSAAQPVALTNVAGGVIFSRGTLTLIASTLTNTGTVQSGSTLLIGAAAAPVMLDNQASGKILSGADLAVQASSATNVGVIQAVGNLTLTTVNSFTNASTGLVATTGNGSSLALTAGSIGNAGTAQSTGALSLTTAGNLANTGTLLTSGAGALTATANTITNSGTIQSGGALDLTTTQATGITLANNSLIASAGAMTLTTPGTLSNTATGTIASNAALTLTGGSTAFIGLNSGAMRAAQNLNLGAGTSRVALTNAATGTIGAGRMFNAFASTFDNSGLVQSTGALALNATGAITNNAGARLLVTGATPAALVLSGASLTNAGTIQSTGDVAATTTGAITNSATLLTTGAGAIALTGDTLNNSGTVGSAAALALTATAATGTTVTNSGTLQSAGALTLTAPGAFANTVATANVISGGGLAINPTATGAVLNSGLLQSNAALTIGGATNRATLTNNAGASILSGGVLTAKVSSATNAGLIQSTGALALDATGALANNGSGATILAKTGATVTLNGANLTNSGTLQAGGALTSTTTGATTNSGTVLTTDAGPLVLAATSLANSGAVKSAGNLTTALTGALTNLSAGKITSDGATTFGFTGNSGTLDNAGVIQSGTALTLASSLARAGVTNSGTLLATGALNGFATTFANNGGTVQSNAALAVDASGAITNAGTGAKLLTGGTNQVLTLTGASLTNSGTLQSSGALTATLTGAVDNSGTIITLPASAGATTLTAGSSLTNTGTIDSGGTAALTSGTTFTQGGTGVIKTAGNLTLAIGTTYTAAAGSSVISAGTLGLTVNGYSVDNSGLLQSAGAMTIGPTGAPAALTNNATGKIQASNLTVHATNVTNRGLLQADNFITVTHVGGGTFDNQAGGQVLAGGDLIFSTPGASFTLNNSGLLQSGGNATLGATNHQIIFTQASGSKLIADAIFIRAGAVDNSGSITAASTLDLTASSFYNRGSASKLVVGGGSGTTALTVTGALTNEGTLFAANALTLSAASLSNSSTGGLASLGYLTLSTSSDLTNNGAIYTANHLGATVGGTFLIGDTGTIDTDGNFTASAATFRNRGQINIGGTGDISAATFENVLTNQPANTILVGPPHPVVGDQGFSPPVRALQRYAEDATTKLTDYFILSFYAPSLSLHTVVPWGLLPYGDSNIEWFETQVFVDINGNQINTATLAAATKPQIAAANLTIRGFNTATNSGLLSTPGTLTINGNGGGSSFANNALTLTESKYNARIDTSLGNSPTNQPIFLGLFSQNVSSVEGWVYGFNMGSLNNISPLGTTTIFTNGAGIKAGTLVVQNVASLSNLGSPFGASTTSRSASGDSRSALVGAGAASGASSASEVSLGVNGATTRTAAGFASAGGITAANGVTFSTPVIVNPLASVAGTVFTSGGSGPASPFGPVSAAAAFTAPAGKVLFDGLNLSLPTNPNGYFVPNRDPNARYKITLNANLGISSDAIGSDFLAKTLGYNPALIEKRLGDPAYETYLVRQQLVAQLGTRLLAGQSSETGQMRSLMTNAADAASQLGLAWGAAPTADQLSKLDTDIVWMVAETVDGEKVLTPQVYLSAKTRAGFDPTNATIAATDSATISVGSLTNRGGSLSAGTNLAINATGDVTNTSGTITGAGVSVKAGGSIINETVTSDQGQPGEKHTLMRTSIGRTATISSTGDLNLDAGKDLVVKGGNITATGDGSIRAGRDIVVKTITDTTADTTTTSSKGLFGGSSGSTTVTDVKNIASNLNFGGNAAIASGGDTTLSGSNLNVGGNLKTDIKGNLAVEDVHDIHTVDTTTSKSGLGVGGGIYGEQKTTVNDFTATSKGSSIKVGGNADITAGKDVTLAGSKVQIAGDSAINATNLNVVDGQDVHTNVTKVETKTFGIFTDSGSSSGAGGGSSSGAPGGGKGGGAAQAEGSGEVTIGSRTTTDVTQTYGSASQGSTLNVGGNSSLNAKEAINVRGSDVAAGGDLNVTAKDIVITAGQNIDSRNFDSKVVTAGLSLTASGSASAEGGAKTNPLGASGSGSAQASGEVGIGLKVQTSQTGEASTASTARVSVLTSGGNMNRTAENKIVDVGTTIEAGGNFTQSAKEITSLAAANTTSADFTTSTQTTRVGLYAEAGGSAEAKGNTGGTAKAEAGGGVAVGVKASFSAESESGTDRTSQAVVSTIKSGGHVTSTSSGKTTLEGTTIASGGDTTLSAESLDFKAAKNTTDSSSKSSSLSVEAKAGLGASGSTGGSASAGATGSVTAAGAVGSQSSNSSEAVTGSIASGGNLTITTKKDARLEGVALGSAQDTTINAGGNVTFDAARNTSNAASTEATASVSVSMAKGGAKKSAGASVEAGYSKETESSSEAVAGSITSGNKLTINSGGKATFEGTDLTAGGDASIGAKGPVEFKQATSTSNASSVEVSAGLDLTKSSNKVSGDKSKEAGVSVGVGVSSENESTAKTSTIGVGGKLAISSGSDVTLQGTNITAGDSVDVNAKGNLNVTAAQESRSAAGFSLEGGATAGKEKADGEKTRSKEGELGVSAGFEKGSTQTGGTITSGTTVNLTSGQNTTLVGTQIEAQGDATVTAGGQVTQRAAVSSSSGGAIGLEVSGKSETKSGGGEEKPGKDETAKPNPASEGSKAAAKPGKSTGAGTDSAAAKSAAQKTPEKGGAPEGEAKEEKSSSAAIAVTDLNVHSDSSKQQTSVKSTGGKVEIKSNTPPPPPNP
jgi:filamentous hemagglutinin